MSQEVAKILILHAKNIQISKYACQLLVGPTALRHTQPNICGPPYGAPWTDCRRSQHVTSLYTMQHEIAAAVVYC